MHRRHILMGWLIAGALGCAPLCPGAPAEERSRSVLEGVAELAKPVSYAETKIPLGELIERVAADTGVRLIAASDVADEPVALVVREMPARRLLEELAELLDYRWSRRRQSEGARERKSERAHNAPNSTLNAQPSTLTYEIWQDLAGKQEEEALRRAELAEVEKRFREQVQRCIELAALPPERLQAMAEAARRE